MKQKNLTVKQIVQLIPHQYLPQMLDNNYIQINIPFGVYMKVDDVVIETEERIVSVYIGNSLIRLWVNTYDLSIHLIK